MAPVVSWIDRLFFNPPLIHTPGISHTRWSYFSVVRVVPLFLFLLIVSRSNCGQRQSRAKILTSFSSKFDEVSLCGSRNRAML